MARRQLGTEVARSSSELTVVDLFAGAGGLSEGFRQAGYRVLGGSDSDPDAMATYRMNFPEARSVLGDIRKPAIRKELLEIAAGATVVVGGPPCQAFSQVRNHVRSLDDPRNSLYREFVRILREVLPPAFVMENVTGLDQMGVRAQIHRDLTLDGEYDVVPQVLDAVDFGVPQTRRRLFFVGIRRFLRGSVPLICGTGVSQAVALARRVRQGRPYYRVLVQEKLLEPKIIDAIKDPNNAAVVTAREAISDLATVEVGNREDVLAYESLGEPASEYQRRMRANGGKFVANVQVPRINEDTSLRLRSIPAGGNYRDLSESLLKRYLTGQRWGQDNGTGRLSRQHFYAYRRLHPGIWAWTLNTKGDSVYHYSKTRSLSVREFARLQSFPDRFVFTSDSRKGALEGRHEGGPAHSRYRQVGNAVPPLLAEAVASALATELCLICKVFQHRRIA